MSGLDIQLEQSNNDNPACKKLVQGFDMLLVIYNRLIQTHGLVVEASCSESGSLPPIGDVVCCQCTDKSYFILLCSLQFFFPGFDLVSGDLALAGY